MSSLAGATQDEVRRSNLSLVLTLLHRRGAQSRSQIVATTGLNRSTVGDLVSELVDLGLARES
ncbi:MAG: helix-turn-helix domain-containing protein, partial [Actinomycetota bacterium]